MNLSMLTLVVASLISVSAIASERPQISQLGGGWVGLARQSDPFDTSKVEIIQMFKGDFTFLCGELNMKARESGFDGFSFDAQLKYVVDNQAPVDKRGKYSTYLSGSKMVTRDRYYSSKLSSEEVESIKSGNVLKVAGQFSTAGWETKSLDLAGFASAYERMCKSN
ncbi:MAG: hypothetical protein HYX64_03255 [Gammaproteobacteria bacterium]|nr:hypothetical protein [Gammaproteobacteria bacterium]